MFPHHRKHVRPPLHERSTSTTIAQVLQERKDRIIPWTRNPLPPLKEGEEEPEAPEPKDAEWVDGFMDLFFVSALSAYNSGHELSTAAALGSYVGFFIVIWWTWVSQVFYDVRYETSDLLHRIIKFFQLCLFGVWASYADSFDLSFIFQPGVETASLEDQVSEGLSEAEASILVAENNRLKHLAWEAVTLVYFCGRILMLFQYVLLMYYTRKSPGYTVRRANWVPICATTVSMLMWGASFGLSHHDSLGLAIARVTLAYGGIFIEIFTAFVEARMKGYRPFNGTNIGERFGLLTLIILGEGVIALGEVTRKVVQSFTFVTATYAQIFCAFLIVFLTFTIYFDGFTKTIQTGRLRSQWWSWLHFPTHLMIILIFTGLKGSLTWTNVSHSVFDITGVWLEVAQPEIVAGTYDINSPAAQQYNKELLAIGVVWPEVVSDLQDTINSTGNTSDATYILSTQDLGQLLYSALQAAGVEAEDETDNAYAKLWSANDSDSAFDLYTDFADSYLTSALGPTLYLAPVSGGFLVLTSLLSLASHMPIDVYGWAGPAVRFTLGSLLCLTGFLDAGPGPQKVTGNVVITRLAAYRWANSDWLLPTLVLVFFTTSVLEALILVRSRKHYASTGAAESGVSLQDLHPRDLEKDTGGGVRTPGSGSASSSQQFLPTVPFGTSSMPGSEGQRPRTMSDESRQRLTSQPQSFTSVLPSSGQGTAARSPPAISWEKPSSASTGAAVPSQGQAVDPVASWLAYSSRSAAQPSDPAAASSKVGGRSAGAADVKAAGTEGDKEILSTPVVGASALGAPTQGSPVAMTEGVGPDVIRPSARPDQSRSRTSSTYSARSRSSSTESRSWYRAPRT